MLTSNGRYIKKVKKLIWEDFPVFQMRELRQNRTNERLQQILIPKQEDRKSLKTDRSDISFNELPDCDSLSRLVTRPSKFPRRELKEG